MKVSIIIPVYNVAPYVARCLESVMAQREADIECILVDDGSTDNSLELVERQVAAYSGPVAFRILRQGRNQGLSAARNTGTLAATGDYVFYLDSDDEIPPGSIACLVAAAANGVPDFVVGAYAYLGREDQVRAPGLPAGRIEAPGAVLSSFLRGDWDVIACNKLIRRDFIAANQLHFAEGLLHEDELWALMLACKAQTMGVVTRTTYLYRIRENSIMSPGLGQERLASWIQILRRMDGYVQGAGLRGNAQLRAYVAIRRTELPVRAREAGLDGYGIYRQEVRGRNRFDWGVFRALGMGWKIRYAHYLLPGPLGYVYLLGAMRVVPVLARTRRSVCGNGRERWAGKTRVNPG